MGHHKTKPPSSFPAMNICPSYQSEDEAGEAAQKGTVLHKCFENYLLGKGFDISSNEMNLMIQNEGIKPEIFTSIEEDDLNGLLWAEAALNEVLKIVKPHERRGIRELISDKDAFAERKLPILGEDFDELTFGTIDVSAFHIIADLKTGRVRNYREQMAAYALAVFQDNPNFEEVVVVELYSRERKFFHYSFTLEEAEKIVYSISDRIDNKENEPRVQNDYCKWCKNRRNCPQIVGKVAEIQKNRAEFPKKYDFSSSKVANEAIANLQAWRSDPDNEELRNLLVESSENLLFLFDAATAAESFFEGVKSQIKMAISEGVAIQGLKIQTKNGKSSITNVEKVFQLTGFTAAEFMPLCSVSISAIEKQIQDAKVVVEMYERAGIEIPEHLQGKKVKLTKTNISKALRYLFDEHGLIEKGNPSNSLVRDKNSTSLRPEDKVNEEIQEAKEVL